MSKVALVTGSVRGIGRATTLALAKEGYDVVIHYRDHGANKELAQSLKEECEAYNVATFEVVGDVANEEDVKRIFKEIKDHYGRLDVLVNNAGITRDALILRMKSDDFNVVIDINLKGVFLCMKQAARIMTRQKSGAIISLSSVVGEMGNAGQVNYAASKAGVIGMTKSLARELGSRHVRVNAVAPGFIATDMTKDLPEEIVETMKGQIPLGAFGKAEDVANAIAFLASDEASYITGQVLNVDGGMAM
jgi:3-oxoacyl-[acyl-carrier protein] reductase